MSERVDITRLKKVYGDRVLVRRLGEPEKKRGILVPQSCIAGKKEPRKIWFGLVIAKGHESKSKVMIGDRVGIEPMGNHYAGFQATDDKEYSWVPDEHIAFKDKGSILAYYEDRLDRASDPVMQLLDNRLLIRETKEAEGSILRPGGFGEKNDAKVGDVIASVSKEFKPGDKVVYVPAESGASATLEIFEPALTVLRTSDVIAKLHPAKETVKA